MLDVAVNGLLAILHPTTLAILFAGLLLGFVVGALPGFDAVNAAAIMLPFTIHFDAQNALVAMVGMYAGTAFAGAVPAILINVPGTAGSAATALDGYQMALKGQAARAISIARSASMIAGVVGALIVLVGIGPMAWFALEFTSPQMFLVGLIAMTIIGSLIGDSVSKGMLSLFAGVLMAVMTASEETGRPRFTMGILELSDAFPFVPVALGLFALSQMFIFAGEDLRDMTGATILKDKAGQAKGALASLMASWRQAAGGMVEPIRHPRVLTRSTLIGLIVGVLPGTGPTIANFVSYADARKHSKTPEQFGKGSPEGVIASEAADSSCVVGTLVPTFTLGVPGSATAAVMMGVAMMHGWSAGPSLMRDHGVEIYAMVWGMLLASAAIGPVAVLFSGPLARIALLRRHVLVPPVILLSLIGAFAVRNSGFDVVLAVLFGAIGVLMRRTGYPVVPLVLGLILAPIIESNFVRSLRLSDYSPAIFFEGWLNLVLWAIFVATVARSVWTARRQARERRAGAALAQGARI